MEKGQKEEYGKILKLTSGFAFHQRDAGEWRLNRKMAGGGPLVDLGIYAIQGTLYTIGELPINVVARDITVNKDFFTDVEGSIEWEFQFPSGISSRSFTSYEDYKNFISIEAEEGEFGLDPAFSYSGLKGFSPDGPLSFSPVNQQAKQMDAIALSIKRNQKSIVPGEMGMRDVYIMEKIYEAAKTGTRVRLDKIPNIRHLV
jgi:predicted dehydrogenase